MQQYFSIKATHSDAILLFRVGDFYETYGEDAVEAASILGIALTRKGNGPGNFIEMAGFPYHAINTYLPKLVRAGRRVAVCEQLEDPKSVKGLVKRGVVELVTPGVVMNENILSARENIFLAAVHFGEKKNGIALLDLSTGEFYVGEGGDYSYERIPVNYIEEIENLDIAFDNFTVKVKYTPDSKGRPTLLSCAVNSDVALTVEGMRHNVSEDLSIKVTFSYTKPSTSFSIPSDVLSQAQDMGEM